MYQQGNSIPQQDNAQRNLLTIINMQQSINPNRQMGSGQSALLNKWDIMPQSQKLNYPLNSNFRFNFGYGLQQFFVRMAQTRLYFDLVQDEQNIGGCTWLSSGHSLIKYWKLHGKQGTFDQNLNYNTAKLIHDHLFGVPMYQWLRGLQGYTCNNIPDLGQLRRQQVPINTQTISKWNPLNSHYQVQSTMNNLFTLNSTPNIPDYGNINLDNSATNNYYFGGSNNNPISSNNWTWVGGNSANTASKILGTDPQYFMNMRAQNKFWLYKNDLPQTDDSYVLNGFTIQGYPTTTSQLTNGHGQNSPYQPKPYTQISFNRYQAGKQRTYKLPNTAAYLGYRNLISKQFCRHSFTPLLSTTIATGRMHNGKLYRQKFPITRWHFQLPLDCLFCGGVTNNGLQKTVLTRYALNGVSLQVQMTDQGIMTTGDKSRHQFDSFGASQIQQKNCHLQNVFIRCKTIQYQDRGMYKSAQQLYARGVKFPIQRFGFQTQFNLSKQQQLSNKYSYTCGQGTNISHFLLVFAFLPNPQKTWQKYFKTTTNGLKQLFATINQNNIIQYPPYQEQARMDNPHQVFGQPSNRPFLQRIYNFTMFWQNPSLVQPSVNKYTLALDQDSPQMEPKPLWNVQNFGTVSQHNYVSDGISPSGTMGACYIHQNTRLSCNYGVISLVDDWAYNRQKQYNCHYVKLDHSKINFNVKTQTQAATQAQNLMVFSKRLFYLSFTEQGGWRSSTYS